MGPCRSPWSTLTCGKKAHPMSRTTFAHFSTSARIAPREHCILATRLCACLALGCHLFANNLRSCRLSAHLCRALSTCELLSSWEPKPPTHSATSALFVLLLLVCVSEIWKIVQCRDGSSFVSWRRWFIWDEIIMWVYQYWVVSTHKDVDDVLCWA